MRRFNVNAFCAAATLAGAFAGPALGAEPADVAGWVAAKTDIPPAQIALVTPDHVYGFEALGPRTATGEVLALVRTEAFAQKLGEYRVQSWEAHLLFDCRGSRVRLVRSANFRERNRGGAPTGAEETGAWMSPKSTEPAARLLAAACDAAFAWPLRTPTTRLAVARIETPATPTPTAPAAAAPPPDATVATAEGYAVQVARGPSAEGARRALKDAHRALGPAGAALSPVIEHTKLGARDRFTAALNGFAGEPEARQACAALLAARHDCLVRLAVLPSAAPASPGYAVQLGYGPSQEGAALAVRRARKALGSQAARLRDVSEASADGARHTALLGGFETAGAAARACETLQRAGLTCFARPATSPLQLAAR